MSNSFILLAAGGTGGHIFPAEALAEELIRRGFRVALVTDKRFAGYGGAMAGGDILTIRAGTLGKGLVNRLKGVADIAIGIVQAGRLIRKLKPAAAIGFGGYPSFPTMMAASWHKIPTLLHEQNAVLGRANRMLLSRVDAVATAYAQTAYLTPDMQSKVTLTGNPVRGAIRALHNVPYPELTSEGIMRVLVMGGSQGASVFARVIPKAVAALPATLRSRLRIDQQCRKDDIDATRQAYLELGVSADLATFFTDVPARLASAHLVITRAGASTVAELMAAGRPAILVPLPTAMDDHQKINAEALELAEGGWVMPQDAFTPQALEARLEALVRLPETLVRTAANCRALGNVNAASALADLVERVIGN